MYTPTSRQAHCLQLKYSKQDCEIKIKLIQIENGKGIKCKKENKEICDK